MATRKIAKAPSPVISTPEGKLYVQAPLPPEVVAAAREHLASGLRLWDMLSNVSGVKPAELLAELQGAAAAIDRDVRKVRARIRRRR